MAANLPRKLQVYTLNRRDLLDACLADAPQAAEMSQQRASPHRTDALEIVEHRAEPRAPAQLAIIGDRESMRLVAHAHEQEERRRVLRQHERILPIRQEHALVGLLHFL